MYALLSFLNQPILNRQLLTSIEFGTDKISEKMVDKILQHRKKIGAFVTINDLFEVPSINSTVVQNLINLTPNPTVITRQSLGNIKNVPLNFLSGIRAFILWWGPILPAFTWGNIPPNWYSTSDLGALMEKKREILNEKLEPLETARKKAEAHYDLVSGLHSANNPGVITAKRLRDDAREAEQKVLDEMEKLDEHMDLDEKKDAWKIIKPNIEGFIADLEDEIDQKRAARSIEQDAARRQALLEEMRQIRRDTTDWQAQVNQVDTYVSALPP